VNRESATGCPIAVTIVNIGHEHGQERSGIGHQRSGKDDFRITNNDQSCSWSEGLDSSLSLVLRNFTGNEVHIFKPLGATFALNEARIESSQ
jgi:hypothetical protein